MHPAAACQASAALRGFCEVLAIPPCLNFGACTDIGRIAETAVALANAAGRELSQMPIAVSVPEYCDQKAVCDGFFGVALGLLVHLSPSPPVGAPKVAVLLTRNVQDLIGGRFLVENDPDRAVEAIIGHFDSG
jgi:carbon-monoxide dehydrogenase catalytic subunit